MNCIGGKIGGKVAGKGSCRAESLFKGNAALQGRHSLCCNGEHAAQLGPKLWALPIGLVLL